MCLGLYYIVALLLHYSFSILLSVTIFLNSVADFYRLGIFPSL